MISWPERGTRVTVRYRRPAGSVPPLTDAVGHLRAIEPLVRVETKTGAVVEFASADVVALRVLTDAPVRTADIRALEHASAASWQGSEGSEGGEQTWLDGWLLRAGGGTAMEPNSAVPLDISAQLHTIPAIVEWYTHRGMTPRLALPDRLLRPPPGLRSEYTEQILVRDLPERHAGVTVDAERHPGVTLGDRIPEGTRWVRTADGATRAYLRVAEDDTNATAVAESLGFKLHHRTRYFPVPPDSL
jgi:N-acetylglutamate synthase